MTELEKSIVTWFNSILGANIKKIQELSDGFALFAIMNRINPELFGVDQMPKEGMDCFTQKYSGLNRLKRGLEKHYSSALQKKFPSELIDLTKIARNADNANLKILIETVVTAMLNYSRSEIFISCIMSLDTRVQTELMEFIRSIINRSEEKQETAQDLIRRENLSLQLQIEDLQNNLQEIANINEALAKDNKELAAKIKALEDVIDQKSMRRLPTELNLPFLEKEINSKDTMIGQLRAENEDLLNRLKELEEQAEEEFESMDSKLADYNKTKSELELYKKRTEDLLPYKKKVKELEMQNFRLLESLKIQEKEVAEVIDTQRKMVAFKDKSEFLTVECEKLKSSLKRQEKIASDTIKTCKELEVAKEYFERQCRDLTMELERANSKTDRSDDLNSLQININEEHDNEIVKLKNTNLKLTIHSGIIAGLNSQLDSAVNAKIQAVFEMEKEKLLKDEALKQVNSLSNRIQELELNLERISSEYNKLVLQNAMLIAKEKTLNQKSEMVDKQAGEIIHLKSEINTFQTELKEIYSDKSKLYEKLNCLTDEFHSLQRELSTKNSALSDLQTEIKQKNHELASLSKSAEIIIESQASSTEDHKDYFNETQELNRLTSEVLSLKAEIIEKDETLQIISEKNKTFKNSLQEMILAKMESEHKKHLNETEELREKIERCSEKIKDMQSFKSGLVNSWKKEMQFVSMIVHDVGMECFKANKVLKKINET